MNRDESKAQIDVGDYVIHPYEGKIWSKKQKRFLKGSNKHSYVYFRVGNDNYAFHRLVYEAFHNVKLTPDKQLIT